MTDDQQNTAIAEECGWVWYKIPNAFTHRCLFLPALHEYEGQSEAWLHRADGSEKPCNFEYMQREGHVPKYTKDLNAMRDAVLTLVDPDPLAEQIRLNRYAEILLRISLAARNHYTFLTTAAQQAEAFLRTVGKWKE